MGQGSQTNQTSDSPQAPEKLYFYAFSVLIFCFFLSEFSSALNPFVRPATSADYGRLGQTLVYLLLRQSRQKRWHAEFFDNQK